jgi:hypothetical protein
LVVWWFGGFWFWGFGLGGLERRLGNL